MIALAETISHFSKDQSTLAGCVFAGPEHEILSTGFNGFPRGIDDDLAKRHERPEKYYWSEHAERNAIYNAARIGVTLRRSTCYVLFLPCYACARGIIQVGAARIVIRNTAFDYPWKDPDGDSGTRSMAMMIEAGIEVWTRGVRYWPVEGVPHDGSKSNDS